MTSFELGGSTDSCEVGARIPFVCEMARFICQLTNSYILNLVVLRIKYKIYEMVNWQKRAISL